MQKWYTKISIMLVVSSREFRANQKNYLVMVDAGQELLIHRGKNKSYRIVPVTEDDVLVSREYFMEPDAEYARALSFEEFKERAFKHVGELYVRK